MINKIIEINNETDFRTLMFNANCETKLHRFGGTLDYFKIKINKKWVKLSDGDKIVIDGEWNLNLVN